MYLKFYLNQVTNVMQLYSFIEIMTRVVKIAISTIQNIDIGRFAKHWMVTGTIFFSPGIRIKRDNISSVIREAAPLGEEKDFVKLNIDQL